MKKWWQRLLSEIVVCVVCGAVLLIIVRYYRPATRQDIEKITTQLNIQSKRMNQLHNENRGLINRWEMEDKLVERGEEIETSYEPEQIDGEITRLQAVKQRILEARKK